MKPKKPKTPKPVQRWAVYLDGKYVCEYERRSAAVPWCETARDLLPNSVCTVERVEIRVVRRPR
jgi:hypothetical protein